MNGEDRFITRENVRRMFDVLLDEFGVDFIIVGGFAVAAHGRVRGTRDLDICPDPRPENLERLARALDAMDATPLGLGEFRGELDLEPDADGLEQGGNWRLDTKYGGLDVMQSLSGLENGYTDLARGAEERTFAGHRVLFCGYADLIAMKQAAGREQDLIDVNDLKAARAEG